MIERNSIHHADAFDLLRQLPDGSADAVITDPPYGFEKTKMEWDSNGKPFDYAAFLTEALRVTAHRGAVVMFAQPPFSAHLLLAGEDAYRYSWYYRKPRGSNFGHIRYQPLRVIEEILVFSRAIASANQFTPPDATMLYFPQVTPLAKTEVRVDKSHHKKVAAPSMASHVQNSREMVHVYDVRQPMNLLYYGTGGDERGLHPTQKPVDLLAYLIRTYTQPGGLVLDPFAGSGTTAVAARQTGRDYIVGDSSAEYVAVMRERLAKPYTLPMLELEAAND